MSPVPDSEQFATVRDPDDNPAPLAHRTDRYAIRNETNTPVIFVDDDPLFSLVEDPEMARENPMKTGVADIRHQHYEIEADDIDESERLIRELVEQFDADTEQRFYYALSGDDAQIGGNGLDDFFDAIQNFRTIYGDLSPQLEAVDQEGSGFPDQYMRIPCVGMTHKEGFWLRFTVWLTESPDEEFHSHTALSLTSLEQQGPLATMWLQDRLDHPALGSPSAVDRQPVRSQASLPLGAEPLTDTKERRLIGYRGRDDTTEYVSCANPYYRSDDEERGELFSHFREDSRLPDDALRQVLGIDRLLLRPKGGSHGTDEDRYVNGQIQLTRFGTANGPGTGGAALLSGKATPIRPEEYEARMKRRSEHTEPGQGILSRLKP